MTGDAADGARYLRVKPTIPLGREVSDEFITPVLERLDMV